MAERPVSISKLDHLGRRLTSYRGVIVHADEQVVVARCLWTLPRTVDLGPFTIAPGDTLIEYYYYHEPFNIFAVYAATGTLKGWYCNVLECTHITDQTIDWWDLALDLVVTPGGVQIVLDEDEFEALAPSAQQRARAAEALNALNEWVQQRHPPLSAAEQVRG